MHAYPGPSPGHLATICHYQLLSRAEHVRRSLPLSIFVISHLHINMNIYIIIYCVYIYIKKIETCRHTHTHIYTLYILYYIYILYIYIFVCVCVSLTKSVAVSWQQRSFWPNLPWRRLAGSMAAWHAPAPAQKRWHQQQQHTWRLEKKRKQLKMKIAKIVHECGTGAYRRNHTK